LLKRAETQFDVLITTDQGLRFPAKPRWPAARDSGSPTTDWSIIQQHQELILAAVANTRAGGVTILSWR
jgi:hypothetical protein